MFQTVVAVEEAGFSETLSKVPSERRPEGHKGARDAEEHYKARVITKRLDEDMITQLKEYLSNFPIVT